MDGCENEESIDTAARSIVEPDQASVDSAVPSMDSCAIDRLLRELGTKDPSAALRYRSMDIVAKNPSIGLRDRLIDLGATPRIGR